MNIRNLYQRLTANVKKPVCPRLLNTGLLKKLRFPCVTPSSSLYFSLMSITLERHSIVWMFANFCFRSYTAVFWTCSMQGEKQQILPSRYYYNYVFLELFLHGLLQPMDWEHPRTKHQPSTLPPTDETLQKQHLSKLM